MKIKWRPQIMAAMGCITVLAISVIFMAPYHIELIAGGAVTGLGMLGMKLLEGE